MGNTISDMDMEIEQKDNKIEFLEVKIGLPVFKVIEELNKLGLNKTSFKRNVDRNMEGLINSLNNHRSFENKKQ